VDGNVVTWGESMLLVVDEIACIVSNERVLNKIQDSPGGSPASRACSKEHQTRPSTRHFDPQCMNSPVHMLYTRSDGCSCFCAV
jgi:hypothetical protein